MARRQPQQERAARRRASILDAAADVLATQGHAAVTTGNVAKAAGASVGTVYEYFADKEAVLRALFVRYRERLDMALREALVDEAQPLEVLVAEGVAAYARFHEDEPGYAALWHGGPYLSPIADDVLVWHEEFASLFADILCRRFPLKKADATRMALTLNQAVSAQIGFAYRWGGKARAALLEEAQRVAVGYLVHTLAAHGVDATSEARPQ